MQRKNGADGRGAGMQLSVRDKLVEQMERIEEKLDQLIERLDEAEEVRAYGTPEDYADVVVGDFDEYGSLQ